MRGAIGGRARRYDARMNILGIRSAAAARTAALAAVLALAGCGGGIWVGIGDDFDDPPAVSLTASSTQAPAGAGIRLIAAAADDDGIDVVEFYRYDGSGVRRLGSDLQSPYELAVTVPSDGRGVLRVFARAYDFNGNAADSEVLSIAITP